MNPRNLLHFLVVTLHPIALRSVLIWASLLTLGSIASADPPVRLRVSDDGWHFVTDDGKPFFWLADTGWEIVHWLDREEIDHYLKVRSDQGFTVIQMMVLVEHGLFELPNRYGHFALPGKDPTHPNEAYFEHIDYVINKAESLGLVVAAIPTWGDKVRKDWGTGPEIFDKHNARVYGNWLGNRYRDKPMVWIIGGDRDPRGYEPIWRALAEGLKAGDGGVHLTTYHGSGNAKRGEPKLHGSSCFFHKQPWLDFNMAYSGHRWSAPNYQQILRDRKLSPRKPTLDGEPLYENHPAIGDGSGFYQNKKRWDRITRANSHQVRQSAYWAILAGAAGHTYGCHDVWQVHSPSHKVINFSNTSWQDALEFHGAVQMGIMRRFFESRPWQSLVPDEDLIVAGQGNGEQHIQAAGDEQGRFLMVYLPQGGSVTVDTTKLAGEKVTAHWFDPRNGKAKLIGEYPSADKRQFNAPTSGPISDWVLVVDDASADYSPPGTTKN